jgi:PAS domain S-box-containing protein
MIVDSHARKIFSCFPLYIIFNQEGIIIDHGGYKTEGIFLLAGDNIFNKFTIRNSINKSRLFVNSKHLDTDVTILYNEDNIIMFNATIDYNLKQNTYVLVAHNKNAFGTYDGQSERFISLLQLLKLKENTTQGGELHKALDYYRSFAIDNDIFGEIVIDKSDSVTMSDINGNVIWCNNAFVQLTGYPYNEIIGKRPRDSMYGKASVYVDRSFVDRNVEKRKPFYFENIAYDAKGKEYWFSAKVYPVISVDDKIIGRVHIMRDITSLKVSELDVEVNENLLKIAIDTSNAGVWVFNIHSSQIDISDQLKRLLLLKPQQRYSIRELLKMINSSDRVSIYNRTIKILSPENSNFDIEIRISVNGAIRYFQLKGKSIRYDSGNKPILLVGTLVDVTEYKEIIRKVDHQRQFYNSILNNIPSDIVVWDTYHKYKYINNTAIKNDGIRSWLIDKDDFDYCELKGFDTSLAVERRKQFEELLSSKLPQKFIEKFPGEKTTYKLRIMYPVITGDKVEYVIGYGIDITEQIDNANIATAQAKELRVTLDIVKDGVATIAFDGTLLEANHSFYNIINVQSDTSVGKNISELFSDTLYTSVHKKIKQLLSSYKEQNAEVTCIIKGEVKTFDYSLTVSFSYQYNSCIKIRITDVTDIVNRENNLKDVISKEIELNKHKTQFIRITSHELRTPLAIIKSSSELIKYYFEKELGVVKYGKYIDNVLYQIDSMADILDQLVLINKMGTGDIKLNYQNVLLQDFIKDVIKPYQPFTDGRHLQVGTIDAIVTSIDPALFKIALYNLLTNSFKYSYGKESPILNVTKQGKELLFSVKDSGIGIPNNDIKHLYKSFFRASNVSSIPGSGIGLTIVDFIVKMHKGTIKFSTELGVGTEFIINLPLKTKKS